ncbi:MAG: 50S ribosomal protein L29 [Candidatus Omnitrophota bacterium]
MKPKELRDLPESELLEKEKALYAELTKLNTQRYTGSVEKPHKFALVKKDIARIRTILNLVRKGSPRSGISNVVNEKKDK